MARLSDLLIKLFGGKAHFVLLAVRVGDRQSAYSTNIDPEPLSTFLIEQAIGLKELAKMGGEKANGPVN